LGLTKPDAAEGYDVAVFNNNADAIDQFAGEMRQMLGGGIGEKLDAIKTDTEALAQALATANANIATLLTQRGSVKRLYNGSFTSDPSSGGQTIVSIPSDMNADKCIVLAPGGVAWHKNGRSIVFNISLGASGYYQIMELY